MPKIYLKKHLHKSHKNVNDIFICTILSETWFYFTNNFPKYNNSVSHFTNYCQKACWNLHFRNIWYSFIDSTFNKDPKSISYRHFSSCLVRQSTAKSNKFAESNSSALWVFYIIQQMHVIPSSYSQRTMYYIDFKIYRRFPWTIY